MNPDGPGTAMEHPGENTIVAFVEGRLSAAEATAFDAHVDICESCRSLVVAAVRASLTTGGAEDEAVVAPASGLGPLERGVRFGRYTLLDVLGRGGMGVVYAAYDSVLERKVALKVLRGELAARLGVDLASARLVREARIAARLSHPNVVTIYDVNSHDGQIFIAMEYVDGRSLSTWLDEGPHPAEAILERFVQAGRGLAAAHAVGLVHRDFKPANVLVGLDGRVRVTDFGLAGWTSEDASGEGPAGGCSSSSRVSRAAGLLGTPLYMAPEQHRGERAGPLADQFSFGVALHEALYRRGAFEGNSLEELAASKARGPAEPPIGGGVPSASGAPCSARCVHGGKSASPRWRRCSRSSRRIRPCPGTGYASVWASSRCSPWARSGPSRSERRRAGVCRWGAQARRRLGWRARARDARRVPRHRRSLRTGRRADERGAPRRLHTCLGRGPPGRLRGDPGAQGAARGASGAPDDVPRRAARGGEGTRDVLHPGGPGCRGARGGSGARPSSALPVLGPPGAEREGAAADGSGGTREGGGARREGGRGPCARPGGQCQGGPRGGARGA
ncbi:protein kinase domain-containing protein [Cystobacter fuscus]